MADRTCEIEGCDRAPQSRNMCGKHYRYWLDHTPKEDRGLPPRQQRDFWSFVVKRHAHGCWTWTGPRARQGYGWWGRILAHRHSWTLANGPIPEGMWALHHCDNPPCVNPAHLYLGTVVENVQDAMDRGRIHIPPRKTVCDAGHRIEGDNSRVVPSRNGKTRSICRACDNERSRLKMERRLRERQARIIYPQGRIKTSEMTTRAGISRMALWRMARAGKVSWPVKQGRDAYWLPEEVESCIRGGRR